MEQQTQEQQLQRIDNGHGQWMNKIFDKRKENLNDNNRIWTENIGKIVYETTIKCISNFDRTTSTHQEDGG